MFNSTEIGLRLREQRRVSGMSADTAARAASVSRALLYRYEGGEIVKLDILDRLARLYGTSATAIIGSGQEFITSSVLFFERLQRLEQQAEQVTTVFGPLAYVLTTDTFDNILLAGLAISRDAGEPLAASESLRLRRVLRQRKQTFRQSRPAFVNIIPIAEIDAFIRLGADGVADRQARRRALASELDHITELIAKPPMGVQLVLSSSRLPTAGFQILRTKNSQFVVTSPFRLGEPVNLRYGVAMISTDDQAVELYKGLAARLWETSLSGTRAIEELARLRRLVS